MLFLASSDTGTPASRLDRLNFGWNGGGAGKVEAWLLGMIFANPDPLQVEHETLVALLIGHPFRGTQGTPCDG